MKRLSWLFFIVCALLLTTAVVDSHLFAQSGNDPESNRALLLAWWDAEAEHTYDRMDTFFTEDIVRHSAATSAIMPDMEITNLEVYTQFLQGTAALFPDYRMIPQLLTAEGDYVAFYATFSGTYAPNGNHIEIPMVGFARFDGGKIAELWVEWDNVTWDSQMGTPEQANEAAARRQFEETWVKRNPDASDEFIAENALWCLAATDSCGALSNSARKDWMTDFLAAFPDLNVTLTRVVASGDTVFLEWRGTGTFSGEFPDMMTMEPLSPTNKMEEWSVLWVGTYEGGKVTREQWYWTWYDWPVAPSS